MRPVTPAANRRTLLIRLGIGICLALATSLVASEAAAARTYNVYGLGMNGAGCAGWVPSTNAPTKFTQLHACGEWYTSANVQTRFSPHDKAGATMQAPVGAVFTGFALDARVQMAVETGSPGFTWRMGPCPQGGTCDGQNVRVVNRRTETLRHRIGTLGGMGALNSRYVFFDLYCHRASGCGLPTHPGRPAHASEWNSHAVVDDYTAPGVASLSGVSTGWNSGARTLSYGASDVGGGVERVSLSIDGALPQTIAHSCQRVPGGGYRTAQPCGTSTSSSFSVNSGGTRLADGDHSLVLVTYDAAGNPSAAHQRFKVDNHAPGNVEAISVAGGQGWRSTNGFRITWRNPGQQAGAPIVAARYKLGSAPRSATDGRRLSGSDMSEISNLELPSSGQYPLYVWLEDAAGNADHRSAELVHLRLDAEAPSIAFHASQDPANPTEVRAAAHDPVSGVVTGSIELRPLGSTTWQPLETRFEGRDLVATFPDDRLPRGSYELRARARDAAGNQGASQRRETGRIMILDSPIRTDTRLTAGFLVRRGRLVRTGGRLAPAVTVAFAQGGVLRGRLQTSEGISLSDAPVTIESRVVARTAVRILGQALTDRDGRFWFRIPAGASRTLRISYSGSRLIRPVQTTARLNVRAYATLRLSPRRLRVGQRVLFAGAVRGGRVYLPSRGKLIQIQFRDGRIWRPAVRLGRTGRDGRYGIRYRFQRISRPTRVVFRILVPAEENWPFETGTSPARHVDVYPRR